MGEPPTAKPHAAFADAFFWIKPPGESDGVAQSTAPRFDPECAKGASWSGAPQAGDWFGDQFVELVQRASPPLSRAPSYIPEARPPRPPHAPPLEPFPAPPPEPPAPVSDDEFFEAQRADWLQADEHPQPPIEGSSLQPFAHRHTRSPPPPSPRPPVPVPFPSPLPAANGPSLWSVATVSFVGVLALASLLSGRSDAPPPARKAARTAPSLPPHIARMAREARYAQVGQDVEVMGGAEDAEVADVASAKRAPGPRPTHTTVEPEPSRVADGEEVKSDVQPAEPVARSDSDSSPVDGDPDAVLLEEARAMAARLSQAMEHNQLEEKLGQLNAKMESLDREIDKAMRVPSAADAAAALAGLRAPRQANPGLWTCD